MELLNKIYADGMGPTYDYTPEGRLSRRSWARGKTTDCTYDAWGNVLDESVSIPALATNLYTANSLNQYTSISNLCASASLRECLYDADGNMTSDERGWHYAWNGENRMVCASNEDVVVTYAYDHRGRMVRKEILPTSTNSTFSTLHSTFEYLWDQWNIIRETLVTRHSSLVTSYIWGLDIDGTLQGAGGVGGLLAVIQSDCTATNSPTPNSSTHKLFLPAYDANGNITEYVATNGAVVAHYEYSAFGEPVVSSGELAPSFTHQFSTKPYCATTGFSEYVYRKYRLNIGRWMSRDPIGEYYNYNIYIGMLNDDVSRIDYLGLSPYDDLSEKIRSAFNSAKEARAAAERCINSLKKPSERRQVGYNDKLNHCISSCEISRNCGETIADALGCIKEARDLWAGKIQQLVWPLVPLDWEEFVYDNLQGGTFQDSVDDFIANFTGFDCKNDQSGCECCCKRKMQ